MRKYIVKATVSLTIEVKGDEDINSILDDMDYSFDSMNPDAVVQDTTIEDVTTTLVQD